MTDETQEVEREAHPLDLFRDQGGVTLADLDADEPYRMPDGTEVPSLVWAAAGTRDEQRALNDNQRMDAARNIDASVRAYRSWIQTRPIGEQIDLTARPVIGIGPAE